MTRSVSALYERIVLARPRTTLLLVAAIVLAFGAFAPQFRLDASADSLVLEQDEDLRFYRSMSARYGSDDYLIVTYTPVGELFSPKVLQDIRRLRDSLAELPRVDAVISILDVPLVRSPRAPLTELASATRSLGEPGIDRELARKELLESPLYRNLLLSSDGRTTALTVNMQQSETYRRLLAERNGLRARMLEEELSPAELRRLEQVSQEFRESSSLLLDQQQRDISAVRRVLESHQDVAELHLGGVPMIVADSIVFIRHDLIVFGAGVFIFLVIILGSAFRRPRWVILPLLTCLSAAVIMIGLLGALGWAVTVVSSNFVSLLLILTLSITLHLIVRYRELHALDPELDQAALVMATVRSKVIPCLYTALTTMVAFGSLLVSGIRPVIDFGWMMVIGLGVAFLLAFTLFPAGLVLLSPGRPVSRRDLTARVTELFAQVIAQHERRTLLVYASLAIAGLAGAAQLSVENSFIDYYHESTEIYRGMALIDRELGGTTPLDVILDAPPPEPVEIVADEDDEDDDFLDDYEADAGITATSYWLNSFRLEELGVVHSYLDSLPETGKVISVATAMEILGSIDEQVLHDDFFLSVVYRKLPAEVKQVLFDPYLSPDGDQLRFSIRVFESDRTLRRAELLEKIREHLTGELGYADSQVHLSGMMVLYNNMLQSLFRSQILTLGAVFLAILLMFWLLFRSLRVAALAIVPNLIAAVTVLGLMGWLGIPLDLMTITIAAITIGIGVDDTIHYVHRFEREFAADRDYWAAMRRSHQTIGRAMYYTSITIMLGFSILALSNFIPTIYFGLLTGFAMMMALVANMTLLPVLMIVFRSEDAAPSTD